MLQRGTSYILSQCSALTNVKNTIEQRTTNAIGKEAFVRLIRLTRVNWDKGKVTNNRILEKVPVSLSNR